MSDADTEKKLCTHSSQSNATSIQATEDCQAGQTNKLGIVAFYNHNNPANRPEWPKEKKSGGTGIKGAEAVATNITALTKDEKAVVAGHRDVFSSYNRDSKM